MDEIAAAPAAHGLAASRIHTEPFGPAPPIAPGVAPTTSRPPHPPAAGGNRTGPTVEFARSDLAVRWDPDDVSLLELAEACDVPVRWSCRTGVCHTCSRPSSQGRWGTTPTPSSRPRRAAPASAAGDRAATSSSTYERRGTVETVNGGNATPDTDPLRRPVDPGGFLTVRRMVLVRPGASRGTVHLTIRPERVPPGRADTRRAPQQIARLRRTPCAPTRPRFRRAAVQATVPSAGRTSGQPGGDHRARVAVEVGRLEEGAVAALGREDGQSVPARGRRQRDSEQVCAHPDGRG